MNNDSNRKGTTQGCPLAMVGYGLPVLLTITKLKVDFKDINSPLYIGKLHRIINFFSRLYEIGPNGYLPEEPKNILIVKNK